MKKYSVNDREQLRLGKLSAVFSLQKKKKKKMQRLLFFCSLLFGFAFGTLQSYPPGEFTTDWLMVGVQNRTFTVYLPDNYESSQAASNPWPLILFFHGGGGSSAQAIYKYDETHSLASTYKYVIVYPQGLDRPDPTWQGGLCCGFNSNGTNDLEFVDALLDHLLSLSNVTVRDNDTLFIDPNRIYSTGHSNGGVFSHRLACERSQRFAAIASSAATIGVFNCNPADHDIGVLMMNGFWDLNIPFNGMQMKKRGRKNERKISLSLARRWSRLRSNFGKFHQRQLHN
jgi:polyhydroxybutyrate depolymerase